MIDTIVVRHYTPELAVKAEKLADLIFNNTSYGVIQVDHCNLTLADFGFSSEPGGYNSPQPISIDWHLAQKFDIPYVRVSRMFNEDGSVFGRKFIVPKNLPRRKWIIDTDMVSGETIKTASKLLKAKVYSAALTLPETQDLIDIEDLVYDISLMHDERNVSYLYSPEFFSRRTSLPESLYKEVLEICS